MMENTLQNESCRHQCAMNRWLAPGAPKESSSYPDALSSSNDSRYRKAILERRGDGDCFFYDGRPMSSERRYLHCSPPGHMSRLVGDRQSSLISQAPTEAFSRGGNVLKIANKTAEKLQASPVPCRVRDGEPISHALTPRASLKHALPMDARYWSRKRHLRLQDGRNRRTYYTGFYEIAWKMPRFVRCEVVGDSRFTVSRLPMLHLASCLRHKHLACQSRLSWYASFNASNPTHQTVGEDAAGTDDSILK